MKRNLVSFLIFCSFSALAQHDTVTTYKKQMPSRATIKTMEGNKVKGWFYKADSNNVYLLSSSQKVSTSSPGIKNADFEKSVYNLDVANISSITLKKKHAGLKGTLIGLGTGVVIGAIIGFASGDDKLTPYTGVPLNDIFIGVGNAFAMTAGEKALGMGIGLGVTGAVVGCVIGNVVKKKFIIGGRKEVYHDMHNELMQRLIIK